MDALQQMKQQELNLHDEPGRNPDRSVRLLGIPTVLDRLIQQAIAQVLEKLWDHTFSESSFGFRPGRGQRDAIEQCRRHVADGLRFCVDIDLSKFFDRVHHDRLMARLATKASDKRVLKLIRKYFQCGVMIALPKDYFTSRGLVIPWT